ncbi:MAG: hypothetical protein C0433_10135 [Cyclobacterium sp.]|nr:hypothetical protein [Cyclobacterium sp.]
MRILGLIAMYAIALFLTGWLLLDVESMLVSELTANKELDIPENVLLDALEDMRYWNRFSVLFTFLILVVKCFLMALVLYGGLFFANLHQSVRLGTLFRIAAFAEVALVLAGLTKVWVGAMSEFTYSEFAVFYPLSLLTLLGTEAVDPLFYYPLQIANLFELLYCVLLVIFLSQELSFSSSQSIKVGLGSYSVSLLFWIVLILFLTLNFT